LIALKLAEFDYLLLKKGEKPIVLLDDDRIYASYAWLLKAGTDARAGRSLEVLREAGVRSQNFG